MRVAILGATGFTGQVLLRLLFGHAEVREVLPVSASKAGADVFAQDLGLSPSAEASGKLRASQGKYLSTAALGRLGKPDLIFSALPHLASARALGDYLGAVPVIDLSADFRIPNARLFEEAYGEAPPAPEFLETAVYGLAEWNAGSIASADVIANPGCYPTASLLPLLPLLTGGAPAGEHGSAYTQPLAAPGAKITINALSGISGAGRKVAEPYLYTSRTENAQAYSPGRSHRHWQEMKWQAEAIIGRASAGAQPSSGEQANADGARSNGGRGRASAGEQANIGLDNDAQTNGNQPSVELYFTPHLVPLHHGMAVSTNLSLRAGVSDAQIRSVYEQCYAHSPFVRLRSDIPETKQVRSTNRCDIAWRREGNELFLFSVIDNLYKGASGQAVQNMNIRFGFPETLGLNFHGEI